MESRIITGEIELMKISRDNLLEVINRNDEEIQLNENENVELEKKISSNVRFSQFLKKTIPKLDEKINATDEVIEKLENQKAKIMEKIEKQDETDVNKLREELKTINGKIKLATDSKVYLMQKIQREEQKSEVQMYSNPELQSKIKLNNRNIETLKIINIKLSEKIAICDELIQKLESRKN